MCLGGPNYAPVSSLQLSLVDNAGQLSTVSLSCGPAGGTHPKSGAACAALDAVDGDFGRLKPRPQACTLIYAPVDVVAIGNWRGTPVSFKTSYGNRCAADVDSDGVFAF